jgi:hypothetical protein
MTFIWEKLGKIIQPKPEISWMRTWTGASFARQISNSPLFEIFITGRDDKNRSQVGKIIIDINKPNEIKEIVELPVISFGNLGAFDENGVSYPWLFEWNNTNYMLYVGWMPTVLTPFMNGLGLAVENRNGCFDRYSRAPILPRNNDDYLSIGSSSVFVEENKIRLYYTSFLKWGSKPDEHKHYYVIKYAESIDGINWIRNNHVCIDILYDWEYSICRPSVIKIGDTYHMWFSYRGEGYLLGYAYSVDGINWVRDDKKAGILLSKDGWDSEMICYSHVFKHYDQYYMIYCGNQYGRDGLGIARLKNQK